MKCFIFGLGSMSLFYFSFSYCQSNQSCLGTNFRLKHIVPMNSLDHVMLKSVSPTRFHYIDKCGYVVVLWPVLLIMGKSGLKNLVIARVNLLLLVIITHTLA